MVTFQGHGICLPFNLVISPKPFKCHSNAPLSEKLCRTHDSVTHSQVKVMEFTLQFCVRSIASKPIEWFSLNFSQLSLSMRRCAEPMSQLRLLKVNVTLRCYGILQRGIYLSFYWCLVQIMHPLYPMIQPNVYIEELIQNTTSRARMDWGKLTMFLWLQARPGGVVSRDFAGK